MCFVFIWKQTMTSAPCNINWLVFITEKKSVYSAVRTGSLNKAACASSVKGYRIVNRSCVEIVSAWMLGVINSLPTLCLILKNLISPPPPAVAKTKSRAFFKSTTSNYIHTKTNLRQKNIYELPTCHFLNAWDIYTRSINHQTALD
jgi:hypothetical protein